MSTQNEPRTWPDLAIGLYDRLTERNAEIDYNFDNFEVSIPSGTSNGAETATWKLNGAVRITTNNRSGN